MLFRSGEDTGDADECWLNVSDALRALRSSDVTKAPKDVQEAVWKRISGYVYFGLQIYQSLITDQIPVDGSAACACNKGISSR